MPQEKHPVFNFFMQACLLIFTAGGFLLTGLKLPQYGLIVNLVAGVFWLYASYRAWKEADQYGIMINTVIVTGVVIYGVLNYWVF
ncbi:MAG TPA: hypothetical protein VJL57_03135 [Candidatus Paceibacterota bacterium]